MNAFLRRSRVSKALTDAGRSSSFVEAESRLDSIRVSIVLGSDQASTPAGQCAALTAIATAVKCFGAVILVADTDAPLIASGVLGPTMITAARALGAEISGHVPMETTHIILIGHGCRNSTWTIRCWWDRWLSGARARGDEPLGDSRLPLSGVFAAALAVRQIFSSVLAGRLLPARDATVSLWEPWAQAGEATVGPAVFDVPNRLWFLGLGHLGQGFIWNLCMLPLSGERLAFLQDDQAIGIENEPTSLLVTASDIGTPKTRVAAKWLEACGWRTALLERRHHGDIPVQMSDPAYLLSGLDKLQPRRALAQHGFDYMIDAGVGHGPGDFEGLQIRVIPKGTPIDGFWLDLPAEEGRRPNRGEAAYADLEQRIGQCGVVPIAEASVAVPFVGAATGALVIAQAIRLASLEPAVQFLQMELGAPAMATMSGFTPTPTVNLGSYAMALNP